MGIKKQYIVNSTVCKVTFLLAKDIYTTAKRINLTGDFNNWDFHSIPMKKTKTGDFSVSIDLEIGSEYQFKYLVDGKDWIIEMEADKFVPNEFQSENSVVIV